MIKRLRHEAGHSVHLEPVLRVHGAIHMHQCLIKHGITVTFTCAICACYVDWGSEHKYKEKRNNKRLEKLRNDELHRLYWPLSFLLVWLNTSSWDCGYRGKFFFQWVFQPIPGPGLLCSSVIIFFTDGRTPWTSDQPVARPLPETGQHIHTPNIHALSGIRTHDPSVLASEDSTCLRPAVGGSA
jgi:hypothetical protein